MKQNELYMLLGFQVLSLANVSHSYDSNSSHVTVH